MAARFAASKAIGTVYVTALNGLPGCGSAPLLFAPNTRRAYAGTKFHDTSLAAASRRPGLGLLAGSASGGSGGRRRVPIAGRTSCAYAGSC